MAIVLCTNGGDTNSRNKNGWTPLHTAAHLNTEEIAQVFCTYKADVNAFNKNN